MRPWSGLLWQLMDKGALISFLPLTFAIPLPLVGSQKEEDGAMAHYCLLCHTSCSTPPPLPFSNHKVGAAADGTSPEKGRKQLAHGLRWAEDLRWPSDFCINIYFGQDAVNEYKHMCTSHMHTVTRQGYHQTVGKSINLPSAIFK